MSKEPYPEFPVLIVDDEENFLDSTKATLRINGITNVECCQDSRKVMSLLERKKFSLILLDIIMPHIGGIELLPNIVEEYPGLQVIMLTAVTDLLTAVECKKMGAFDYICKPFEGQQLLDSIRKALKHKIFQT
jgi:DNA-binding NtrC family response regulator